ncbi:MAG: phage holin family protein [Gammaproteobacteria bacterium]|nr:phage holin family protein [Gammaproteobacteria bacterium]MDH4312084.1 phage holin family protein [Gammaproteobacteria bacterium]MDH5273745.1 phage holin family protein [Gammaproteobacteria bacterium]
MDDSDIPRRSAGGLFDSLRALIATLVAMAHTRVELFGTELEEEVRRVVALLLGGVLVLALASVALVFSGLVVIAAYWDTHRVAATAGVAIGFMVLAAVSYLVVRERTRRRSRLLSSTLDELERDLELLDKQISP